MGEDTHPDWHADEIAEGEKLWRAIVAASNGVPNRACHSIFSQAAAIHGVTAGMTREAFLERMGRFYDRAATGKTP